MPLVPGSVSGSRPKLWYRSPTACRLLRSGLEQFPETIARPADVFGKEFLVMCALSLCSPPECGRCSGRSGLLSFRNLVLAGPADDPGPGRE